jgi:hypothetical protein
MILVNFSHPVSEESLQVIHNKAGKHVDLIINRLADFNEEMSYWEQTIQLVDSVGLSAAEWQNEQIIINLPSLAVIAGILLAELHGRMGYFPTILRFRRVSAVIPPQYEIGELISLQEVRGSARTKRKY